MAHYTGLYTNRMLIYLIKLVASAEAVNNKNNKHSFKVRTKKIQCRYKSFLRKNLRKYYVQTDIFIESASAEAV